MGPRTEPAGCREIPAKHPRQAIAPADNGHKAYINYLTLAHHFHVRCVGACTWYALQFQSDYAGHDESANTIRTKLQEGQREVETQKKVQSSVWF